MNAVCSVVHIKTEICRQNVDFLMLQLVLHKETTWNQTVRPTTKFNRAFSFAWQLLNGVVSLGYEALSNLYITLAVSD